MFSRDGARRTRSSWMNGVVESEREPSKQIREGVSITRIRRMTRAAGGAVGLQQPTGRIGEVRIS
jgi:hypothetical protein